MSLGDSLEIKVVKNFLKLSLNVLYQALFRKNKRDWSQESCHGKGTTDFILFHM